MTNVQTDFDPQRQQDAPQDLQTQPTHARKTLLLLGLLAITGAAWWTLQDRSETLDAAPSFASTEPLPAPIDESPITPML